MKFLIMQFSPTSCHFIRLWYKTFSSAHCSQTHSVHVPPLTPTMFHTHTETQAKL
jgi:hypothetical protein